MTDLMEITAQIKPKNTPDHNGMSSKFLKIAIPIIAEPLLKVTNQCLENGIFPDVLKNQK